MDISVVILTYNRPDILSANLRSLASIGPALREIIVVDNSTDEATSGLIAADFPWITYLRNDNNAGVAGRNVGLRAAGGKIVITLDDDVIGLDAADLGLIADLFESSPQLGALCFRVLHHQTGEVCNWCHHRRVERDALASFDTYEISEGAVAYRREALDRSGLYFEKFFISHEGKDLAYRLMNQGYTVRYDGRISVVHHIAGSGRTDWRRYYYDTRNAIWLAARNMPAFYATRFLLVTLGAMAVYSLRDGYVRYWFKAVGDGLRELPAIRAGRTAWTAQTAARCAQIDALRPGFSYKARRRLFRRGVQI